MLDKLIENTFKNTRLKRVRIKSDPTIPPVFGYENVSQFEGYVLEECGEGMVNVYIINAPPTAEPVQQISVAQIEPIEQSIPGEPSLQTIKIKLLSALAKAGHGEDTPIFNQIKNTNSLDFIRAFLLQANLDVNDVLSYVEEATDSPAEDIDDIDSTENTFGRKEGKYDSLIKAAGKGLSFLNKIVGVGADLTLGKDNIIARLNRFLKSFNINDLVNIKKVTDRIRTKDYEHMPYNNDLVLVTGLPKLSYNKVAGRKYQLKGRIKTVKFSTDGLLYVVDSITPSLRGIRKIYLDFAYLQNPGKSGKIIFEDETGTKFYNKGTISLVGNIWLVNLGAVNIKDYTSENKKDSAFIAIAISLLKDSLGNSFDEIARRPDYSNVVADIAVELKQHSPEVMAQIEKFFTDYLPKQEDFSKLSPSEKLNSIKGYLKKFKE
jgi:hypothetical protein